MKLVMMVMMMMMTMMMLMMIMMMIMMLMMMLMLLLMMMMMIMMMMMTSSFMADGSHFRIPKFFTLWSSPPIFIKIFRCAELLLDASDISFMS